MKQIRQGDILLEEIDKLPDGIKEKDKILALGEVTGHSHRFESSQVLVFEDMQKQQFLDVKQKSELIHEEHNNILIPKGKYRVIQQREFDIVQGIRQVMD